MDGSVGKKSDVRITQVNLEAMLGFERYIGIPSSWPLARSSKTSHHHQQHQPPPPPPLNADADADDD